MHKRTQLSQLSTKYTQKDIDTSSSSYVVNKKRDMFQPLNERNMQGVNQKEVIQQNGQKIIPKNVLIMNPCHSRSITWPQIFMPDEQLYVSLKGNFYTIRDSRNKQKFIERKSMPYSETVYFNVQKNNDKLVMVSVQKYMLRNENEQNELWYHVDLVIWNVEDDQMERRWAIQKLKNNIYSGSSMSNLQLMRKQNNTSTQIQEFKCIQLVDSYRNALIVFDTITSKQSNNHRYEIVYIDFSHNKNKSSSLLSSQYIPSSRSLDSPQQNFNINNSQSKIVGRAPLQRLQAQTRVKLINSDYGDIVLLVTSEDIYELQINSRGTRNQHSIIFKPLNISRMLLQNKNTYISTNNIANLKQSLIQQQLIIDAKYIPSQLKVLILTSHGRVMVIQSEQCIFTQSLYQLLSPKDVLQLYNIEYFLFKNIHFLNGFLIVSVQAEKQDQCNLLKQIKYEESILDKLDQRKDAIQYISRGLVVAKLQSNTVSFNKFISLPFDLKTYKKVKFHSFQDSDQLLIQTINTKNPQMLQLYKCQIISNKNSFIPFQTEHFLANNNKSQINTQIIVNSIVDLVSNKTSSGKVIFGKSQRMLYLLRGNQISCYKINTTQFSNNQQSGIKKTFSSSFFQKPIKLITNPLTGQIVVLFKEFIKIFSNVFTQLRLLNHINIREVKDISFSRYGENMLWVMNDNTIHLVDSYTFKQHKIMDFQGQVKQILYPSQYLLAIKSSKNMLSIYKKRYLAKYEQKTDTYIFYDKLYQIKIQTDDLYYLDQTLTVLLKKNGIVEIYSHVPEPRSKGDNSIDDNQQLRYQILKNEHFHLVNRKNFTFDKNDSPNYLFYSSQFSTLFIGTRFGHVYQYLYPFLPIEDPSPPESYQYQVASTPIIHIQISADFQYLYTVSEMGEIIQLKFQQFLNGLKKNGIYVVSKTQNVNENLIKYEFANRTYLMDTLVTINTEVSKGIEQNYEQICFIDDKIKNDIEDVTSKIKSQSHKQINKISSQKKTTQSKFKSQFDRITLQMKQQQKTAQQKLHQMCEHNQKIKQQMVQNYEKQLLQIYRQNDRLKKIMHDKMRQFHDQNIEIKQKLLKMREQQENMKNIELQKLQQSYSGLGDKYSHYQQVANEQIDKNQQQLQQLRQHQMQKYTQKLLEQQKKKQGNLSQLGKIQKQIQRFKKRSIYFQNLIVQTRNQIEQLAYDVNIYQQKKSSLMKELQNKQETIELKQTQIIGHLKKTTEMKKIKNIHQFQLQQFQAQIFPVQKKISQLQNKVRQMNHQIMLQFNSKVEQNSLIQTSNKRIQKLKLKSKNIVENALNTRTKMLRFTQQLTEVLANDPFANDIRKKLSKVIDNFSINKSQTFAPNYDIQKQKKNSQHLIKRKNMLLKSIERQQRLQQGVIKNKNQFFRFYSDNTNLVKQYNQLFKDHNILMNQKIQLQKKINALKQENHKTPVKRTTSLHTIKKVSGTKLTPFQRYEQEHIQLSNLKLKQKDTTQTRISRGQSSSSFLKSLIKDVTVAQSKYQKANLMRDRIRTFVNPELQRQKQIQRQLFQRQKGKSSYMPVLKL